MFETLIQNVERSFTLLEIFSFLINRFIIHILQRKVIMMGEYTISKALNNNVIICTYNNQEVILIGKGIGFNKSGMT